MTFQKLIQSYNWYNYILKATIHCEVKNENFVKYKIQSLNLDTKIKAIDFIMNLINNSYNNFKVSKVFVIVWGKWKLIFEVIETAETFSDSKHLEILIKDIFNEYKNLYESNLIEFGNKTLTPYMHTLCHIPGLIRKYSKISIFNCQAIEELNNFIKQQISSNNNNYDTTKSCVKYFSRNNLLLDSQRVIKKKRQWSQESKSRFSFTINSIIKNKENNINVTPLKKL